MTSRPQMMIEILRSNAGKKFTARELASEIIEKYELELAKKRENPRFKSDEDFVSQIAAEIGGERTQRALKQAPQIQTRDQPRPRLYSWSEEDRDLTEPEIKKQTELFNNIKSNKDAIDKSLYEHDLYPLLIKYLHNQEGLYCRRIDEKRSVNDKGSGGNHWLYPDMVALEIQGGDWQSVVKSCLQNNPSRLWSFEVKRKLNRSNVRQSFFQAVSNSSWAHFGYLVTTEINEDRHNGVLKELQMLSALHGIGVMILNHEEPSESQMLIPAREKISVDWDSVNRLVEENSDFEDFIELVGMYNQTGKVRKAEWNK